MITISDVSLLIRTLKCAAERHRDQQRKGEKAAPYINHPIEVAELLWEIGGIRDFRILAAALLHDTVEDTDMTIADIEADFGRDIARMVAEITDDMSLDVTERRARQIDHAAVLSFQASQIKIADKISNLSNILSSPPSDWSNVEVLAYAKWSHRVVDRLRGNNQRLEQRYDKLYRKVTKKYGNNRMNGVTMDNGPHGR